MSQLDKLRARARSRLSSVLMGRGYFKGKSAPVKDSLLYSALQQEFVYDIAKLETKPKNHADFFVALCAVLGVGLEEKGSAEQRHLNAMLRIERREIKRQEQHENEWRRKQEKADVERMVAIAEQPIGGRLVFRDDSNIASADDGNLAERASTRLTILMWGSGLMMDYPAANGVGGQRWTDLAWAIKHCYGKDRVSKWIHGPVNKEWSGEDFIAVAKALGLPLDRNLDMRSVAMLKDGLAHRPKRFQVRARAEVNTVSGCDVASVEFLSTYEWRRVRMEALKKYGARCQCCGATPATGAVINVDHIKPRKLFPQLALSVDNLQVLCHECNHGKGNWDMTDWRQAEVEK